MEILALIANSSEKAIWSQDSACIANTADDLLKARNVEKNPEFDEDNATGIWLAKSSSTAGYVARYPFCHNTAFNCSSLRNPA